MTEQEINQKIEERKGDRMYSNIITSLWRYGFENGDDAAVEVDDLQGVVNYVGKRFRDDYVGEPNIKIFVQGKKDDYFSMKFIYAKSETYKTDDRDGVCADGDPLSIRYARIESGRIFKMKCGKFVRRLVDEMYPELPEPVRVYFTEQLSAMYRAGHAADGRYTLTLDKDFARIYDGGHHFGSCMAGKGQWKFYRDSMPDAQAAGLWDGDRLIARCIVWNAKDADTGEVYRLAERQYGDNAEARRQLIYLLAEKQKIDGHKQFEAGCYDNRSYVLLNGESLRNKHLYVDCTAEPGDTLSFQDGFRYLNFDEERAYNYEEALYDADLATTHPVVPGGDSDEDEHDGQTWVEADQEWYDDDDVHWLEYRNEYRHCEDCDWSECEDRYLYDGDATPLYDNDYCHNDNAVEIEAGTNQGEYAHCDDSDLSFDYADRRVLISDCYELTHGEHKGALAPTEECVGLDHEIYGYGSGEFKTPYALECETVETESGYRILDEDAVEVNGRTYHKDECVRAMDRRERAFVDALPDDCVEICGTYYLMCVA